jgi:hypothetical protein
MLRELLHLLSSLARTRRLSFSKPTFDLTAPKDFLDPRFALQLRRSYSQAKRPTLANMIIIDEAGDMTVEVVEKHDSLRNSNGSRLTKETAQFKVRKDALTNASQTLLRMLLDNHWKESTQSVVALGEYHVSSTEVWLRVIHRVPPITTVPFAEMWHLVAAIDYYELDVTDFNAWFAAWYDRHNPEMYKPRELLFPTWRFGHAKGFAQWTQHLAYHGVGHVTELNPTELYSYRLPSRIIRKSI